MAAFSSFEITKGVGHKTNSNHYYTMILTILETKRFSPDDPKSAKMHIHQY